MFYFDKNDPRVLFCDIRTVSPCIVGKGRNARTFSCGPDVVCDFTSLPFGDASFNAVVFDPPHIIKTSGTAYMQIKYGALEGSWREMLRKGFLECFRVLKPNGILIFKWNETDIKVGEILALTLEKPVFGHRSGKRSKTHWICFMKGGG